MFEKSPFMITNKVKQSSSGSWGHPTKFEKRETRIKVPEDDPVKPLHKRKRRVKKPYISPFCSCPFCQKELPLDQKAIDTAKKEGKIVFEWSNEWRIKECPNCQAYEVVECPACGRKTWFDYNTKYYKHQWHGCGFNGQERRERK